MKRFLLLLALLHLMKISSSKMKCLSSRKADKLMGGWLRESASPYSKHPRSDFANRSVSPWQYRVHHDKDRFPPNIYVADCKFEGCIINGLEDKGFNSVQVFQTKMVLKRMPCPSKPRRYYFEVGYVHVPVACTCVVPR